MQLFKILFALAVAFSAYAEDVSSPANTEATATTEADTGTSPIASAVATSSSPANTEAPATTGGQPETTELPPTSSKLSVFFPSIAISLFSTLSLLLLVF
ncbi:hypothetical protein EmuJ_000161700 [Echinococcus multilocularis]|uniref:Uncharacterized protein n=1 Tax=Echinococcus multilocularis TaxID=6211 RepID=A0A077RDD1_ECHMU|nr:hypothetical protein EmuJ_000161600 [Echinococcus multilocularis]CDI97812.1 hypothetical protein EmuJ_000161700 [Echinococcus multilocularis]